MSSLKLSDPLGKLPGIGSITEHKFTSKNLSSISDLLHYFPKEYIDIVRTTTKKLEAGQLVILYGTISKPYSKKLGRLTTQTASLQDHDGKISLRFFNQPYLPRSIKPKVMYEVIGKIEVFRGAIQLINPQIRITKDPKKSYIRPIYRTAADITSKSLEKHIHTSLDQVDVKENLDNKVIQQYNLSDRLFALSQIHFPSSYDNLEQAVRRLSFEELYLLQLNTLRKSQAVLGKSYAIKRQEKKLELLEQSLDFQLTHSQQTTTQEIILDLGRSTPMNRLLVGDVGSGKTIVAIMAAYNTTLSGKKTHIVAPTQILAEQLFTSFSETLAKFDTKIQLITAKSRPKGDYHILIGTHAILNLDPPQDLALVIYDEQHKFGVEQRTTSSSSQFTTHRLTMTATPIPRTLALTLLSTISISRLTDKPEGRKEIKTYLVPEEKRQSSHNWIKTQVRKQQNQVFIVAPLIEQSDSSLLDQVKSAKNLHQELSNIYSEFTVGLLHGKMNDLEKVNIIHKFGSGDIDILVATTIVEVGIDIPEANIMIIESAERFGLAQLHQLRGRVGRNKKQGYCLVFATSKTPKSVKRLQYFVSNYDGEKLAEMDMKLRGPGQVWGHKQHGFFNLKLADIFDHKLVKQTYLAATATLAKN